MIAIGLRLLAALAAWCAPMREQAEICLVGGTISIYSIYDAGRQGVLAPEEIQTALEKEIPVQYREAVRFAIAQRTGS